VPRYFVFPEVRADITANVLPNFGKNEKRRDFGSGGALRRIFIEPRVAIVGVCLDDTVLHPTREGALVDPKAGSEFLLREEAASAQSVAARAKLVPLHDILHALTSESRAMPSGPRRSTWTKPPSVEDVGDLGIDVIVEQSVDEVDDLG